MEFFDIRQHRNRIREGLLRAGCGKDADYVFLGLIDARPTLLATGDGREAIIYTAHGYAIVATDSSGFHIPLKQDWMIGVYRGNLNDQPEELLVLECDAFTRDY